MTWRCGEHICMHPFRMWNRLRFHTFMQASQIFQRRKSDANKEDFENKLNLTCQAQSTPPKNKDLNQGILHLWSKFGGPSLKGWWVIARTSSKWGKFWLWSWIWPWRSRSITPKNIRDLNQGLLHLWSKFVDPSWNGKCLIGRTSSWLTHGRTHTHTDRRRQRQYPKANTGRG